MSSKPIARVSENVSAYLTGERTRLAEGVTAAVNAAGRGLQRELRAQTEVALGSKLGRAWDFRAYPNKRASLGAAALVYSKAAAIHEAFNADTTIIAGRSFLVIPTEHAIAMGFGKLAEARGSFGRYSAGSGKKWGRLEAASRQLGAKKLATVRTRGGNLLVLYRPARRAPAVPLFVLVPQVTLRKRLDIDGPAERWLEHMSESIRALFERE